MAFIGTRFVEMFCRVFDHAPKGKEWESSCLLFKQGWRHEVDYGLQFCTLAAGSGGNELALKDAFCQGLNTEVLTELACWDDQVTLYSFLDLAICLDNHAGYQASGNSPGQINLC